MRKKSIVIGLALAGLTWGVTGTALAGDGCCPSGAATEETSVETKGCPVTGNLAKTHVSGSCGAEAKDSCAASCAEMDPAKCAEMAEAGKCETPCAEAAKECGPRGVKSSVSHATRGIWTFVNSQGEVVEPSAEQLSAIRQALADTAGPSLFFASVEAADPADLSKGFRARPTMADSGMRVAYTPELEKELRQQLGNADFEKLIRSEIAPNWRNFDSVQITDRPDGIRHYKVERGTLASFSVLTIDENGNPVASCVTNADEARKLSETTRANLQNLNNGETAE